MYAPLPMGAQQVRHKLATNIFGKLCAKGARVENFLRGNNIKQAFRGGTSVNPHQNARDPQSG